MIRGIKMIYDDKECVGEAERIVKSAKTPDELRRFFGLGQNSVLSNIKKAVDKAKKLNPCDRF